MIIEKNELKMSNHMVDKIVSRRNIFNTIHSKHNNENFKFSKPFYYAIDELFVWIVECIVYCISLIIFHF